MRSTPLIINWHDKNLPIYSAHFETHGKGRLATAAGDSNVRLWKVECDGEERKVEYLATLSKHAEAVNVVRWAPKGETLASAGDDGNVILWVPSEHHVPAFGNDGLEDKETWRTKHMSRSSGAEIYDLAWSPDGTYFIVGSMDNIARIYNAGTGQLVRQIAEHSHYVQGVTWDPLNEYIATQSSDRSVHIYSLKTKDGRYTLSSHDDKPPKIASHTKTDLPPRRISSDSPAPPDFGHRSFLGAIDAVPGISGGIGSPVPSAPGTPTTMNLPMNPPSVVSHSRRSSFSSRRSASPAPSMPLPAVMPMDASPKPPALPSFSAAGLKNSSLYANETYTSFFRRLTFTPDGSLLLTPAGQYQSQHAFETLKPTYETVNTVYIYSRAGINKPPIAHLPGHKKPSIAIRCSPMLYTLRSSPPATKHITIDTSSAEESLTSLPEPLSKPSPAPSSSVMDPPPPPTPHSETSTPMQRSISTDMTGPSSAPKPAFALPYRMVYAVATQDSVLIYDTQQQTPICVVSNLHCAAFTDLTWASDGLTLLISSTDGFCSALSFAPGELGEIYRGETITQKKARETSEAAANSHSGTPIPTPTALFAPPSPFHAVSSIQHRHRDSVSSFTAPSPPPPAAFVNQRPSSPARSNSTSSVMTQSSMAHTPATSISNPPTLIGGSVPSITAASPSITSALPLTTPPETPRSHTASSVGMKRDLSARDHEEVTSQAKKKRITPTLVSNLDGKPT